MLNRILKFLRPTFDVDADAIDARLRAKPSRAEFVGIALAVSFLVGFLSLDPTGQVGTIAGDFHGHMAVAHGEFKDYFYPNWFVPYYSLLAALPFAAAFSIMGLVNILGIWFACRVFNGNPAIALNSYQTLYVAFWAQTTGILLGGLALMYWAMTHKRYVLAGLGLMIGLIKYEQAIPLAVTFWLLDKISWKDRLKVAIIPIILFGASLIAYPLWPIDLLHRLNTKPPDASGSIVLWQWIGAAALVLWLPVIFVRLSRSRRIIAVAATTALAIPYMQQSELLLLYALPTGGIGLLGNFGFLLPQMGFNAYRALVVVPSITYVWVFVDHFRHQAQIVTSTSQVQDLQPAE